VNGTITTAGRGRPRPADTDAPARAAASAPASAASPAADQPAPQARPVETSPVETSPVETSAAGGRAGSGLAAPPWLRIATTATAVLAALAVVAAGWYGLAWYTAVNGTQHRTAALREEVVRDARQVALNLESIDYQSLDADLARWEASVTGPLLEEFRSSRERYAQQVRDTQAKAEATIVDVAVTELNPSAGTAEVLVFVNLVTSQHSEGNETGRAEKRQRIKLELTRTDGGWKASQAGPVGARS
jgi:Mce-associated membrane protein